MNPSPEQVREGRDRARQWSEHPQGDLDLALTPRERVLRNIVLREIAGSSQAADALDDILYFLQGQRVIGGAEWNPLLFRGPWSLGDMLWEPPEIKRLAVGFKKRGWLEVQGGLWRTSKEFRELYERTERQVSEELRVAEPHEAVRLDGPEQTIELLAELERIGDVEHFVFRGEPHHAVNWKNANTRRW